MSRRRTSERTKGDEVHEALVAWVQARQAYEQSLLTLFHDPDPGPFNPSRFGYVELAIVSPAFTIWGLTSDA